MLARAESLSVSIAASPSQVFEFVRREENLSRWNKNAFCPLGFTKRSSVSASHHLQRYENEVETPCGSVLFTLTSNEELGVVDRYLYWGTSEPGDPIESREAIMPGRVIGNGSGAEFILTILHPPMQHCHRQSNAPSFNEWISLWKADLYLLKSILEAKSGPSELCEDASSSSGGSKT